MRNFATLCTALALGIAALGLSGCGSGSGTDSATAPEPPLDRMYRTLATSNSIRASHFHAIGERRGVDVDCRGRSCEFQPHPTLGFRLSFTALGTAREFADEGPTWTAQGEIGGIEIWKTETDVTSYGAWLDYTGFRVVSGPENGHSAAVSMAFGRAFPDAPIPLGGTVSYDGAMVGKDVISDADYAGAARLEVDFAAASLDATFSGIADIATGEGIPDIEFSGVTLNPETGSATATRLPSAPGTDTYFRARIYGPIQEEIGGIFGKDTLIGGFGAKRQ